MSSESDNVIGREMEIAGLIVVPRAGREPKYLHHSVPTENNGQIAFEMQFDFFEFMILSQ